VATIDGAVAEPLNDELERVALGHGAVPVEHEPHRAMRLIAPLRPPLPQARPLRLGLHAWCLAIRSRHAKSHMSCCRHPLASSRLAPSRAHPARFTSRW